MCSSFRVYCFFEKKKLKSKLQITLFGKRESAFTNRMGVEQRH